MDKVNKLFELILMLLAIVIAIQVISSINTLQNTLANSDDIEYTYKDWSSYDIELAMKYHGIQACTITDTQAYFIGKHNKQIKLFTDGCIEWIIKEKQRSEICQ